MDTCRTAAVAVARPRWHRARPDLNGLRAARTRKGELRTRAQVIEQAAAPARLVDRLLAGAGATGSRAARVRTAVIAWRDARRTIANTRRRSRPSHDRSMTGCSRCTRRSAVNNRPSVRIAQQQPWESRDYAPPISRSCTARSAVSQREPPTGTPQAGRGACVRPFRKTRPVNIPAKGCHTGHRRRRLPGSPAAQLAGHPPRLASLRMPATDSSRSAAETRR